MRIDFSGQECSTCFHFRTSGTLNTQEFEPSNVTVSSVTSMPVSSEPVQAFGHDSPRQCVSSTGLGFAPALGPATFGSMQAPAFGSGSSFAAHTSSTFGSMQTPAFGSGSSFAPPTPSAFGSMQAPFAAPTPSTFGSMQAPVFASGSKFAAPTSSTLGSMQTPAFGSGSSFATPTPYTFGSMQAPAFGSGSSFAPPTPYTFGSMQAPVEASASNTSTPFSFGPTQDFGTTASASPFGDGVVFARPDIGILPAMNTSTTTVVFGATPVSVSSLFGPTQDFAKTNYVCVSSTTPKNPFNSLIPGFGVGYLPGSSSNIFGPNQSTTTSLDQTHHIKKGSRCPHYEPTPDLGDKNDNMFISISASKSYQHKTHEELRWEDYKQGDKGGLFPADISSIGSRPNAVFSPSTPSSTSGFAQPYATFNGVPTLFPSSSSTSSTTCFAAPVSSCVQRPHETNVVSSPAFECTTCGATSNSSASGYFGFNVASTPPSAARYLPGMYFSTYGSYPMMFGATTTPSLQAYPMMFGTNYPSLDTNLAVQYTYPAVEAYPVDGFVLLPFTAMNLQ